MICFDFLMVSFSFTLMGEMDCVGGLYGRDRRYRRDRRDVLNGRNGKHWGVGEMGG